MESRRRREALQRLVEQGVAQEVRLERVHAHEPRQHDCHEHRGGGDRRLPRPRAAVAGGSAPRAAAQASSGTAAPTGPLQRTASPIARPASGHHRQPSPVRRPWRRQSSAAVTSAVSGMSKMTSRAKTRTSGAVAIATAAIAARRGPRSVRPMAKVSATVAIAASTEGSRAANSVTPSVRKAAAIAQKSSTGLSRYGRWLKCGTLQVPSASISRATSALRPSSGSSRGQAPSA